MKKRGRIPVVPMPRGRDQSEGRSEMKEMEFKCIKNEGKQKWRKEDQKEELGELAWLIILIQY